MTFTRLNSITDYGATVLRVSLGVIYLAHAHLKIFTFTLAGTVDFFTKVGFPGWMAYPVTFAELAAGVALIIGWNARWIALALTPVLIGAAITLAKRLGSRQRRRWLGVSGISDRRIDHARPHW